jgi:hypothetical protein
MRTNQGIWGQGGGSYIDLVVGSVWKGDVLTGYPLTRCSLPGLCKDPLVTPRFTHPNTAAAMLAKAMGILIPPHGLTLKAGLILWTSATKTITITENGCWNSKVSGRGKDSFFVSKNFKQLEKTCQTRKTVLWVRMHNKREDWKYHNGMSSSTSGTSK